MFNLKRILIIGSMVMVVSCTDQSPSKIKNSILPPRPVKPECSQISLEKEIIGKNNLVNLFECSGWTKEYPNLYKTLKEVDAKKFNHVSSSVNETLLLNKKSRSDLFKFVSNSNNRTRLDDFSRLLEISVEKYNLFFWLEKLLEHDSTKPKESLLNVLSSDNKINIQFIQMLKSILKGFEAERNDLNYALENVAPIEVQNTIKTALDEVLSTFNQRDWEIIGKLLYDGQNSALKAWAQGGSQSDVELLLEIIESKDFIPSITYLRKSLKDGIKCNNSATGGEFEIDVAQELKHKIESLKFDEKHEFQDVVVHGLTKFIAFAEFCSPKSKEMDAFLNIVNFSFEASKSDHDYNFLKKIHLILNNEKYRLLDFLASSTFEKLQTILLKLSKDGRDEYFVKAFYNWILQIDQKTIRRMSETIQEIGKAGRIGTWKSTWSKAWSELTTTEKNDLLRLIELLNIDDLRVSGSFDLLEKVFLEFPSFPNLLRNQLEQRDYQENLKYILKLLARNENQGELARFLSQEGLFQLLEIFTTERKDSTLKKDDNRKNLQKMNYVLAPDIRQGEEVRDICKESLMKSYKENQNYYQIVIDLPDSCIASLGRVGFVGTIYVWMHNSHNYFKDSFGVNDFHGEYGIWAPGMLHFLFNAAIKINNNLISTKGERGLLLNLDRIRDTLVTDENMEAFHLFSKVFDRLNILVDFQSPLRNYVERSTDQSTNLLIRNFNRLLFDQDKIIKFDSISTSCEQIESNHGVEVCLANEIISGHVVNILRLIKRKNEDGRTLLGELIKWLHPNGGIDLPNNEKLSQPYRTNLDEIIRFLNDLSSEKTKYEITYHYDNGQEKIQTSIIDRLEILIRDIGFSNNFYGAYFKNQVATAEDYNQVLIKSYKLIGFLQTASGPFRGINRLPKESRWKLKNVKAAYDSLLEVNQDFYQANGSKRSYGHFIQSLLEAIRLSSRLETQDFNAYRVPSENLVEGHNGLFLTEMVRLSTLRRMANLVRKRMGHELTALESPVFKKINSNLIGRFQPGEMEKAVISMLDKYLDNGKNQLNLLALDMVNFFKNLSLSEQEDVEEVIVKFLYLLSDEKLLNSSIKEILPLIELSIKHWPSLRNGFFKVKDRGRLLEKMNQLMDGLTTNPQALNYLIIEFANSNVMKIQDFEKILTDQQMINMLTDFVNHVALMRETSSELNLGTLLRTVFESEDLNWSSIKFWLINAIEGDQQKLSLRLLFNVLGEKSADGYRLEMILNELLLKHRKGLEQFLKETFPSMSVN